ncbi:SDR family oxidoreductase [Novosphingobium rosa]|uniref:SDR family oxidoreductase n=1 Tax=Novosphingobium rosa TaxID=76978 RepID=UPI000835FCC8|nr:SDR family oxidoreductase [Novosphingobium rosa]
MRLENRTALITGAARGLGADIARLFAAEGARVLITDVDAAAAAALADDIGGLSHPLDVTREDSWRTALAFAQEKLGGLSILVNNAGIPVGGPFEDTTLADWRRAFAVHADGAYLGCRLALPLLRESQPAAIVNMASIAAHHARPEMAAYGASKAAVCALTRSVALHCTQNGWDIRCNALLPAYADTAMVDSFAPTMPGDILRQKLGAQLPMGRIATAREIAEGALYLASPASSFMTGAELRLDGGLSAR